MPADQPRDPLGRFTFTPAQRREAETVALAIGAGSKPDVPRMLAAQPSAPTRSRPALDQRAGDLALSRGAGTWSLCAPSPTRPEGDSRGQPRLSDLSSTI